jgi:cephalosporin-C deacetylase-like acetyl esterase
MNIKHLCLSASAAMIFALSGAVTVTTDRSDAIYKSGEEVTFTISPDTEAPATQLRATLSLDGGKQISVTPIESDKGGKITAKLDAPGVLQLCVSGVLGGKKINVISGAAYDPEKIIQGKPAPADFDEFWKNAVANAEKIALDPQITKLDKYCDSTYNSYEISVAAPGGRVFGYLTIPVQPKPVPLLVGIDASGSGRNMPIFVKQFSNRKAVLWLNVHNYSPSVPTAERNKAYKAANTPVIYYLSGNTDREKYYFYRTLLGFNRIVNYVLASRPELDPEKVGLFGVSQGGGLGLMLTALNKNIKGACVSVPALCDHHAFEQGRRPGWPRLVNKNKPETSVCAGYYDVANFCKNINVPVWFVAGLADTTCPPASICAAFNAIPGSNKTLFLEPGMGHSGSSRPSYGNSLGKLRVMLRRMPSGKK